MGGDAHEATLALLPQARFVPSGDASDWYRNFYEHQCHVVAETATVLDATPRGQKMREHVMQAPIKCDGHGGGQLLMLVVNGALVSSFAVLPSSRGRVLSWERGSSASEELFVSTARRGWNAAPLATLTGIPAELAGAHAAAMLADPEVVSFDFERGANTTAHLATFFAQVWTQTAAGQLQLVNRTLGLGESESVGPALPILASAHAVIGHVGVAQAGRMLALMYPEVAIVDHCESLLCDRYELHEGGHTWQLTIGYVDHMLPRLAHTHDGTSSMGSSPYEEALERPPYAQFSRNADLLSAVTTSNSRFRSSTVNPRRPIIWHTANGMDAKTAGAKQAPNGSGPDDAPPDIGLHSKAFSFNAFQCSGDASQPDARTTYSAVEMLAHGTFDGSFFPSIGPLDRRSALEQILSQHGLTARWEDPRESSPNERAISVGLEIVPPAWWGDGLWPPLVDEDWGNFPAGMVSMRAQWSGGLLDADTGVAADPALFSQAVEDFPAAIQHVWSETEANFDETIAAYLVYSYGQLLLRVLGQTNPPLDDPLDAVDTCPFPDVLHCDLWQGFGVCAVPGTTYDSLGPPAGSGPHRCRGGLSDQLLKLLARPGERTQVGGGDPPTGRRGPGRTRLRRHHCALRMGGHRAALYR